MTARQRPTIAILGGGFSGAAVAYHAAQGGIDARLVVVEPRLHLGGGLAYSTTDPAHRINVPAGRMSLISQQPSHFIDWLAATDALADDPAALTADGQAFPRRRMFGAYVASQLAPLLAHGTIEHIAAAAIGASSTGRGFALRMGGGQTLAADIVVLAMSHPAPALPAPFAALAGHPSLIENPYATDALAAIAAHGRVLIVGTGLTSGDMVASLDRQNHRGPVTLLSRHGLRSAGHAAENQAARGDFSTAPAIGALTLLRAVRAEIAAAAIAGQTWHPVIDAVRQQGQTIWAALPLQARRQLLRHLRTYWDVHRFRIAPQTAVAIERRRDDGSLRIAAGRLLRAGPSAAGIAVHYRARQSQEVIVQNYDSVIITTGPNHGGILASNPVLAALGDAGIIARDAVGLGLATGANGLALGVDAGATAGLYVSGPLARGTVGELMGLPEVTRHAEFIAAQLLRTVGSTAA